MKQGSLKEFWEDAKKGVYNFTQDGKCSCCGNCCSALLPVTNRELSEIKRYAKKKHISITKHNENVAFDLTCPFRDDESRICKIYSVRPQICRDFRCDKPQMRIDESKERYQYDSRFHTVNLRSVFE